jgi:hypothetical protein
MARPIVPTSGSPALVDKKRIDAAGDTSAHSRDSEQQPAASRSEYHPPGSESSPVTASSELGLRPTALPSVYRGKSSGEFQRAIPHLAPDANALISEAEHHLASLPASDRNRRLLEVAILRRDTALLSGLLESLRKR